LGKIIAVLIIAFYTYVDKITGLFVCSLVILFYQTNYITSIENMDIIDPVTISEDNVDNNTYDILDDGVYFENDTGGIKQKKKSQKKWKKQCDKKRNENNISYLDLEDKDLSGFPVNKDVIILNDIQGIGGDIEEEFRKRNCDKGHLKNKGLKIKNEMAPHVFSELEYKNVTCNPCSKNCDISIIDNKLTTEEEILHKNLQIM